MDTPARDPLTLDSLTDDGLVRHLDDLADLLHACVHAEASVGFILPFAMADSRAFWLDSVRPSLRAGRRVLLAAWLDGRLVGTVQLGLEMPPNQPHRADVAKLLVHPEARRRGIARQLMRALEDRARQAGRTLLVLDTRTDDRAEPLYRSLGYQVAGTIPGYARNVHGDAFHATTYMYKALTG